MSTSASAMAVEGVEGGYNAEIKKVVSGKYSSKDCGAGEIFKSVRVA